MIQLEHAAKRYGRRWVFRDLTLSWEDGGWVGVVGPNGAGKSTLIRCLAGITRLTRGRVMVFGANPWEESQVRRQLGLFTHAPLMYPTLTGKENLQVFARFYGLEDGERRIAELSERLHLRGFLHRPLREYSQGMRVRLALARSLLHRPRLLLLDEPFASLDPEGRMQVRAFLRELRDVGVWILSVTHHPDEVRNEVQAFWVLSGGTLSIRAPAEV